MEIELVVFDLDGTLIDSKRDLVDAVNATLADAKRASLPDALVSAYVGNGAPVLIRRALGEGASEEQVRHSVDFFLGYYRAHMLDHTRLYPGVQEGLDSLHTAGIKLAVLTNKPVRFSQELIRRLALDGHFQVIYGGNSFNTKKPEPEGLLALMADARTEARNTLVVGDSAVDVQTARNAGTWACGVTYGFQPEGFTDAPPDILVGSLEELAGIVLNHREHASKKEVKSRR